MISHLAVALSFCCRVMASKQMVLEVNVSSIFPELAFLGCAPHASVWVRHLRRLGTAVSLNSKDIGWCKRHVGRILGTRPCLWEALCKRWTRLARGGGPRRRKPHRPRPFLSGCLVFDSTTRAFPTVHNSCWPCQSPCYILYRTTNEDS